MSLQIKKSGVFSLEDFIELGTTITDGGITCSSSSVTFKPGTSASERSGSSCYVSYSKTELYKYDKLLISMTLSWSNFSTSNSNGTFKLYFSNTLEGGLKNSAQLALATSSAFDSAMGDLTSMVLSSTRGQKTLSIVCDVPDELTYEYTNNSANSCSYAGQNIYLKSEYSNGTGSITMSNVSIKKYDSGAQVQLGDEYIRCTKFYEL